MNARRIAVAARPRRRLGTHSVTEGGLPCVAASKAVLILAAAVLLPSLAFAQGTLTGTVRDESGGVLPGVTVEASSPALIEKVRTAVTDGAGQYRITGLNPGTYSLTFTLTGFNIVKREGIELSGTATLTIPVEMRVGALEETITVTGETPVVDVQTTQRETVLSADVVAAIPGNRSVGTLLNAVPGLTVNDGALAASPTMTFFAARGGPINEGRMAINGMTVAAPFNGGGVSTYILDSVNVDEVSVAVAGGLGESDIGGPVMNLVPRSGGNAVPRPGVHQQRGRLVAGQQPERRAARRRPQRRRPASSAPTTRAFRMAARSNATDSGSLAAIAASIRHRRSRVSSRTGTPSTRHAGTGWQTRASRRASCRGASRTWGGSRRRCPTSIASRSTRSTSAAARGRR